MKVVNLLLFVSIFFTACSQKNENEVIVYTTVDEVFSQPILKDFEKQSGIKVKAIYDTEETKSTGVLNRLLAESNNPQCDLFWSGDPARAMILKNKSLTKSYNPPIASDIKDEFKDKEFNWIGFSARARVLLYNKKLIKKEDLPISIFDFKDEKYKGKFAIANPLFGTTSFHVASWFSTLGDKKAKKLLESFKNNDIIISSSNGDIKKKVLGGDIWFGLTDTDDAFTAMQESDDVDIIFLDQKGVGNLIIPNTLSLIKNSPNQENAKKLFNYLLSKETEKKLAISCAQMPLHKNVKTPVSIPSLDSVVSMKIDYVKSAKKLQEIQPFLKTWVEDK